MRRRKNDGFRGTENTQEKSVSTAGDQINTLTGTSQTQATVLLLLLLSSSSSSSFIALLVHNSNPPVKMKHNFR
jgi:hypothetical protein